MRLNKSVFVFIAIVGLLLIAPFVVAQQSQSQPPRQDAQPPKKKEPQRQGAEADQQQEKGLVEKIDTDLVLLDVAVIDQSGKPIMNLKKEEFQVYENKIIQPIESVDIVDAPLSLGIVIDTSGSMRTKLQTVSDSALTLVKQMKDEDEAFIAQFKAEAELLRDFTRDKRELEDGLNELFTGGGTALLDAIIATADHAQSKGKQRKKALVVISDGVEKNSSWKEKEVIKAIQEDDVQVYLVGILDESDDSASLFGKSATKKAKDLLIRLAEDSGGRAFFPKDASEMPAVMAQVAKDLRSQYVIGYSPTNDKKDGTYRTIKVVATPKDTRKLIVRTRQGYTAKGGTGATQAATDNKLRVEKPQ
ncbi:MAG: VWA domain-containing protein [Acidobacteria bacterium]|nr:VWA domain-containing protein [Acidobacteriota bacterium]